MIEYQELPIPDLREFTHIAGQYIGEYGGVLGAKISQPGDFQVIPGKNYTAKSVARVTSKDQHVGDINLILFRPGDGTGDESSFSRSQVSIPDYLMFKTRSERVIPRRKEGVLLEVAMPLFSVHNGSQPFPYSVSLSELFLDRSEIPMVYTAAYIGSEPEPFSSGISSRKPEEMSPSLRYTVNQIGEKFGNPHSILHHPAGDIRSKTIQVAGFFTITDRQNPLYPRILSDGKYPD